MRFGLTGCHGGLDGLALDEQTELIQEAEHLGYESIWLNEEHFQAGGRFCLSPVTHASYLAARTERLRLGFSVLLVPLHDPLRLAEEIASLDQLSGGRVEVGISRGGNERYHHAFGIEYAQRTTRYLEALACMLAFWAGDGPVDFAGEHFTYNAVEMTPKPVQRPHPPIHVGARDPDSVRRAAISGYALLEGPVQSLEYSLLDVQAYRSGAASVGRVVDPNALTFGRFVFLAEDDARARAQAAPVVAGLVARLRSFAIRDQPYFIDPDHLTPEGFADQTAIVGGPETCIARVRELQDRLGFGRFTCAFGFFGLASPTQVRRSLRLFAEEVMPAFA
jgi:alkanesulfonate monooxygenase SsuD/methylene tetrahydromethanopterin reductase-like flavin-dependent oxidoreductase (luciferase family)